MKKSTAKKSAYNIVSSILNQVLAIALGIIIPRLYLTTFGSEVNGLLNSVNQIYTYLALLEAGVGTATLQALYKPVAQDDENSISAIMAATNRFYKRTGTIYFILVVILSIGYPLVVKSNIPFTTVFAVIMLNGLPAVIGYFFQGKFKILLQAEGKNYIITNLTTIINFCVNASKVVLMLCGFSIISIQVAYFVFQMVQVIFIMLYMKRHYKWMDLTVKPDYDAISQKNSVLVMQISDMIFRNTDIIVLTIFCDLKVVSVYAIFNMLFSTIVTFMDSFSQGFDFALGQRFNTDRKAHLKLHDVYETYRMTLVFSLLCIARIFIIPFISLYTKGVTDINYVDNKLAWLFVIMFILTNARNNSAGLINFAKHFKQTQWRCVAEAVINITVSIACVYTFGIYGVLIGTIVALLYRANDMIIYANRKILNRSPWVTYKRVLICTAIFAAVTFVSRYIHVDLSSYFKIILWAAVASAVIIPLFFGVMSVCEPKQAKFAYAFAKEKIKNKLKRKSNENT